METFNQEVVGTILHQLNSVVEGILVLLKPGSQDVRDSGGVVNNSKMCTWVGLRAGLLEVPALAKQVLVKLGSESQISGLGEERLLLKNGQETHGLLKHGDALLQIHAEVNIGPLNTFPDVFFLLQDKHVLVEELLELLITEVDTDLLEAIVVEDLKASNVQATDVLDLLHGGANQGVVTLLNNESEDQLIDLTANTSNRAASARASLTLGDPLSTDLQLGLTEVGDHPLGINTANVCHLLGVGLILDLSLLFLAHWDEVLGEVAHVHDDSSELVDVVLLLSSESKDVVGLISEHHVFLVINGGDSDLAL